MKYLNWILQFAICLGFASSGQAQFKRANKRFDQLSYEKAGKLYLRFLEDNPNNLEALTKLAECYRLTDDFPNTEAGYQRVVSSPMADPRSYFHYGEALMNNKKWDEAAPWFEKFLTRKPEDPLGSRKLWSSQNYTRFMQDSSLYRVVPTAINTPEADFGPSFDLKNDAVVFASARQPGRFTFKWNGRSFLDLYRADFKGNATLGNVERLKGQINTELHEGGQTFSQDGSVAFFSRNNLYKGKIGSDPNGIIRLKTYRAEEKRGKFKKIEGIPFNSDEYSVGHPSLTADQKTMYFTSDMPGGEGGTDIYMVRLNLERDSWGEPINMGSVINTPGDEMFPWVSESGVLYFASNGQKGLGGLDLFVARKLESLKPEIENMGYPINSPRDDFSLILDENRGLGYFSSNRAGGEGDDDIYMFFRKQRLKGIVLDAETGEEIEEARVELYDTSNTQAISLSDQNGIWKQGLDPKRDYLVVVSKEGYKEKRKRITTKGVDPNEEVAVRVELEKADDCKETIRLEGLVSNEKGNLLPGTKVRIIKEETVVADEEGKITGLLDPDSDYSLVVAEPGLEDVALNITTKGASAPLQADLVLPEVDSGQAFYIIYYNFDMYNIRTYDARPELDRVVVFMNKYPEVKVKLASHTDCRASDSYNIKLSRNRALEAFEYIASKGIEKERLSYEWKGEHELSNRCADGVECSEEEHQLNRRTEFLLNGSTRLKWE